VVVANLSLMADHGLKWPTTFGELLKQCKVATDKGINFFGFAGGAVPNLNLINAAFGSLTYADTQKKVKDSKFLFANSLGWRTSFEQMEALRDNGCFQNGYQAGGFGDAIDARFFAKKAYAVLVPGGTSKTFATVVPPLKGQDIVTAYIPAVKAADSRIPVSSDYAWAANARTKNAAGVKVFINFAATTAGQKAYTDISGSLSVKETGSTPEYYKMLIPFLKAGKTYAIPYNSFSNVSVTDRMAKGAIGILTKQTTISRVLRSMDAAW